MDDTQIIWDDDPGKNVEHCLEHDVTAEEVEEVLLNRRNAVIPGELDDRFVTFGYTSAGRYLLVAWISVLDDPRTIYPVTSYEVPEPQRTPKRKRRGR